MSPCPPRRLGHVAEGSEPAEQRLVAGSVGLEALRAEQAAERVEGGSHMDVEVRVDATSHTTRSFYDGHGHPFSLGVEGWHGRSGSERRAVQACSASRTNHPNSETGRAAVNVRLGGFGRRRFATSRTPSQTGPASTPEAIQDQQSSGGPSEKYQCTGTPNKDDGERTANRMAWDCRQWA